MKKIKFSYDTRVKVPPILKINLVLFHVFPWIAGIQRFMALRRTDWTPVSTGVTLLGGKWGFMIFMVRPAYR
jgi:hypothetical protein